MTIRSQLLLIVALPIAVIFALAGVHVHADVVALREANSLARSVRIAVEASELVDELQNERLLSVIHLTAARPPPPERIRAQHATTDARIAAFRADAIVSDRADLGPEWSRALGDVELRLGDLARIRGAIASRDVDAGAAFAWYSRLVDATLGATQACETPITRAEVRRQVVALRRLRDGKERAGRVRSLLAVAFSRAVVDRATYDAVLTATIEERMLLGDFVAQVQPAARAAYAVAEGDPSVAEAGRMRERVLAAGPDAATRDDADAWVHLATIRMDRLGSVEDVVERTLLERTASIRRSALSTALLTGGIAVLTSLLVIVAIVALARRILRRLGSASGLAERLANGDPADLTAFDVGSADEIGTLMRAMRGALEYQRRLVAVAERIARGDLAVKVEPRSSRDVLGRSLARVVEALRAQRVVEEELRTRQKLDAIDRIAHGMAHEMGTPLQFVLGSVDFLAEACRDLVKLAVRRRDALEGDAEEIGLDYLVERTPAAIARANEGLDRLGAILKQMKELSSEEAEERTPIDLNRAVEATLQVVREDARGIARTARDLEPRLRNVLGCARDLNRVLLALLVNAVQAIQSTGKEGAIRVTTCNDGSDVLIAVADDGPGIDDAIKDCVFDPFFTTREVGSGSGQGLAVAQSIVRKHGGTIAFESTVGKGTTFYVRLPAFAGDEPLSMRAA